MILRHRETVDLDIAERLVALMRKRALVDQRDPEHRMAAGHYYAQAKQLGQVLAAKRAETKALLKRQHDALRLPEPQRDDHGTHG